MSRTALAVLLLLLLPVGLTSNSNSLIVMLPRSVSCAQGWLFRRKLAMLGVQKTCFLAEDAWSEG